MTIPSPGLYRKTGCYCGRYHVVRVAKSFGALRFEVSPKSHYAVLDGQVVWNRWYGIEPHTPKKP